jgi:hypothetical protein
MVGRQLVIEVVSANATHTHQWEVRSLSEKRIRVRRMADGGKVDEVLLDRQ